MAESDGKLAAELSDGEDAGAPNSLTESDPEHLRRCEQVAVHEWYASERILFEQKAMEALQSYKQTGLFKSVFPPPVVVKGKKGKKKNGQEKQKRGISAYNLFIRYEIEDLKAKGTIIPGAKITDTIRSLGSTWTNMNTEDKAEKSRQLFTRHAKEHPDALFPGSAAEIVAAARAEKALEEGTAATDEMPPKKKGKKTK